MIRAVLFDLYETLVTERGTMPTRASSLGHRFGLDGTEFRKAWKPHRIKVIRGELSFADALLHVGARLGRALDSTAVHRLCEERRLEKMAVLARFEPELLAMLGQLRDRGLKLAVVSNCFAEDVEPWPRCRAALCFDSAVFSCDVGIAKPEPRIYLEAVRRLGTDPAETMFVGDGGDDELLGAERVGLRAAQATWYRGALAGLSAHIPRLSSWSEVLALTAAGAPRPL